MSVILSLFLTATFHPASTPQAGLGRWLVILDDSNSKDLETRAVALVGKDRVARTWPSVSGFLTTSLDARTAELLASLPGVRGVYEDVALDNALSTPLPDCSQGPVLGGPLPTTLAPQSISCDDPDPQNAAGVCPDNWGLDRLDSAMRDGRYQAPRLGTGVRVFVVDTGVYSAHQEFTGRVGQGFDATMSSGSTEDCGSWSHGTHVAAIAVGTRYGVAKGATLHPIRVAGCPLSLAISSLVGAFDWIAQMHATTLTGPAVATMSINASLAEFREPTQPLGLAITAALNSGVLVVESAGNQAALACDWSTNVTGALIVGGSDEFDTPWERRAGDPNYAGWCPPDCGSNTGSCISLFAPAAHIVSAWFGMTPAASNTCRLSGTSMAAPAAAGAAALYLQANPTATPAQVKQALISRATASLSQLPAGTPNLLLSVVEGTASATISPRGFSDLGTVETGTMSAMPLRLTVTSTGTLPLRVNGRTLGGSHAGDFVVSNDTCSTQAVTTTCTLDVSFWPTGNGARSATLTLTSNASPLSVTLTGTGRAPSFTVQLDGTGTGRVVSQPEGIDCDGGTCTTSFYSGTMITLVATPDSDSMFDGWQGCNPAGLTCLVTARGQQTVSVTFTRLVVDAGEPDAGTQPIDAGRPDAGSGTPDAGRDAGTVITRSDAGVTSRDAGDGMEEQKPCGCAAFPVEFLPGLVVLLARRRRSALHGNTPTP